MKSPPRDARVGSPTYNLNQDRPIKYYFMNRERRIISDEIFELKDFGDLVADVSGQHLHNLVPLPFLGQSLIAISDNDYIYTTWTEDFLIKVYDPDGNYLRAFYYPFRNNPLSRDEVVSLIDKKNDKYDRDLVEHAKMPQKWPAIRSMFADGQNQLWVSTIVNKAGVREWWILKNTGELIAKFNWPDNRSIKAVKDGFAYALVTDSETGQQKLVKYRVEME
ncbi:MAG: hypothetical protein PVI44_04310 [Balneolaceae bacterium]